MVQQIDDAVLVLKKPTSSTWADDSSYSHVVSKVGTPTFATDHFECTASNYFSVANHAVFEPGSGVDLTWLVVYQAADDTPPAVDRWLDSFGAGASLTSNGFRIWTAAGGTQWALIENRGDSSSLEAFRTAESLVARSGIYADGFGTAQHIDGVGNGSPNGGSLTYTATGNPLIVGAGIGDVYAAAVWRRRLTAYELVEAKYELLGSTMPVAKDDAVLLLHPPTADSWADDSGNGHTVAKSGSPTFTTDHWETTLADFFYVDDAADLDIGSTKHMTYLHIYSETTVAPASIQRWLDKMGESSHSHNNAGYRNYRFNATDHWGLTAGTGAKFDIQPASVAGTTYGRLAYLDGPNTDVYLWRDERYDGTAGTGTHAATTEKLRVGGGAGNMYGLAVWERVLTLEEVATARTEVLAGAGYSPPGSVTLFKGWGIPYV